MTTKTVYSLIILNVLKHETNVGLDYIAHMGELPAPYVQQLLFKLKRYGIVTTKKGPNGGYSLNPVQEWSVLDVMEAVGDKHHVKLKHPVEDILHRINKGYKELLMEVKI